MRWEAVALALFSSALQAGLKTKVESSGLFAAAPLADRPDFHCHCNCFCGIKQESGLAVGGGTLLGATSVLGIWFCCGQGRAVESSPSHRRRGYGVISKPSTWTDLSSLLR